MCYGINYLFKSVCKKQIIVTLHDNIYLFLTWKNSLVILYLNLKLFDSILNVSELMQVQMYNCIIKYFWVSSKVTISEFCL